MQKEEREGERKDREEGGEGRRGREEEGRKKEKRKESDYVDWVPPKNSQVCVTHLASKSEIHPMQSGQMPSITLWYFPWKMRVLLSHSLPPPPERRKGPFPSQTGLEAHGH